jgi:hypothetical protein
MGSSGAGTARRPIAVTAFVLIATACHSGDGVRTTSSPGPFTRPDLGAIVLGPTDAPQGTSYVAGASGFQDLRAFARDAVELGHLREDGFEIGHLALFFPNGHIGGGASQPLTNRSKIVQGITGLFRDARGAERSFERYVEDLRSRQLPEAEVVPTSGLGDAGFGLRGTTPDGARVQMYVWRTGNLILAVSVSGPVGPGEVRSIADLLDART